MGFAPRWQRHNQHLGRIQHALHLELHEIVLAHAQRLRRQHTLLLDQRMNAFAHAARAYADKTPRLHEPHAGRMVRRTQQAQQDVVPHRAGRKVAHIAPLVNGAVDRSAFLVGKRRGRHRLVVLQIVGRGVAGVVGLAHACILSLQCRAVQECLL